MNSEFFNGGQRVTFPIPWTMARPYSVEAWQEHSHTLSFEIFDLSCPSDDAPTFSGSWNGTAVPTGTRPPCSMSPTRSHSTENRFRASEPGNIPSTTAFMSRSPTSGSKIFWPGASLTVGGRVRDCVQRHTPNRPANSAVIQPCHRVLPI
jgi:hypothetical protein